MDRHLGCDLYIEKAIIKFSNKKLTLAIVPIKKERRILQLGLSDNSILLCTPSFPHQIHLELGAASFKHENTLHTDKDVRTGIESQMLTSYYSVAKK